MAFQLLILLKGCVLMACLSSALITKIIERALFVAA
jgi:hypothetical protein